MARFTRDRIVVGASAGGVEALRTMVSGLPEDLRAAVLVVMHLPAGGTSALPLILDRAGPLPARAAVDGADVEPGHIYVAGPNQHLLLTGEKLTLSTGPTENGHRPAVNALFRSAALSAGPRAIGVVLSGVLDDGALGLRAIVERGGVGVTQSAEDALYPGMPEAARQQAEVSHVVPASRLGALLGDLSKEELDAVALPEPSPALRLEDRIARNGATGVAPHASAYTCPDCWGSLTEVEPGAGNFRCRIGHAWSAEALLSAQGEEFQHALGMALRSLDEKAGLARRMAADAEVRGHSLLIGRYGRAVEESAAAAVVLRRFLTSLTSPETGEPEPT
ncbi:chemotaxis protein CheB [Amycolatopsis magusensis]|uniref:chemotaxis protein CheB n=1 Tax=Amycolatopsis magusensis TaxID=882444 RepID=UPI0037ACB8FE